MGKTETAHALAEFFFGDPEGFTKIQGEGLIKDAHAANLFGSSKMYVGYKDPTPFADSRLFAPLKQAQEDGKAHPSIARDESFSIVLVDEFDKVHDTVRQNFLGIFDKGKWEFSTGSEDDPDLNYSRVTDFRRTVFILTSNLGERDAVGIRGTMGF